MNKLLFAGLLSIAGLPLSHAYALPQVAWTCTYKADASSDKTMDLSLLPINIQIGPEKKVSQGTMTCLSPALPAVRCERVTSISQTFDFGATLGLPVSGPEESIQINGGFSASPQHMFGKFQIQAGAGADLLLVRLSGDGGVEGNQGELAGVAKVAIAPTRSIGGNVEFGTVQFVKGSACQ